MRRLKSILTPPTTAGRGLRIIAVASGLVLAGLVGAGSVAVAAQRPARIVADARADAAPSTPDHAYLSAAMDPIYKVAWPEACGFGSGGPGKQVFVQTGDGCSAAGGPQVLIRSLEGVSPLADPRAAFTAVKAACDAGRPVRIAFSQGGAAGLKTAACASPPVAPPAAVRFTVDIAYDPAIAIVAGDRLEISLDRDLGQGSKASSSMDFELAPGALPQQAFADLLPPLLPADRRTGPMFGMSARIIDKDGVVKAVSDRDLGRPHAPYLSTETTIWTKLQMVPSTGARSARDEAEQSAVGAARMAAATARAALSPAQQARADAARSGEGFKAICSGRNALDIGLCDGVMYGAALRNTGGNICLPEGLDYGVMARRATARLAGEAVRPGEGAVDVATRAIAKAYPCGAVSRPGIAGLTSEETAVRAATIASARANGTAEGTAKGMSARQTAVLAANLAVQRAAASDPYSVVAEITESDVKYTTGVTLSGQARLALAEGRYRMTIDRTAVEPDRVRSDIRVWRKAADGSETVVTAPSMVSQRDKPARFQLGIEGGDMIEVTVGPPGGV